jgi:uncharacterized protein YbjT (DUF2867 family)
MIEKPEILVTGATGNVGRAICERLAFTEAQVYAGVRDVDKAAGQLPTESMQLCQFDFEKAVFPQRTFDAVFFLRPPHMGKVEEFDAFFHWLNPQTRVVFLSVQGAGKQAYLPHAKLEKRLLASGFAGCFVRPGYFMENLTTTMWSELVAHRRIFLPAGKLRLDWIAVRDIAEISVLALFDKIPVRAVEVSTRRLVGFSEVVEMINQSVGTHLRYESPSVLRYLLASLRQGKDLSFLLVMCMIHFIPRFKAPPQHEGPGFEELTGFPPQSLEEFIQAHRDRLAELK